MTRHFCNVLFSTFFLMATSCATAQSFENQPLQSQQRAEDISATSLIEVDLNGLGLDNVRWMGVAQYGHGPMQLVVEVPRASKWMGSTCLKFKNMVRVGEAWALNTGGYNIVYENTISSQSDSYANRPDPARFQAFDRTLRIAKEQGTWEIQAQLKPSGQQSIRWTDDAGNVRTSLGTITSMKKLQENTHCSGLF